MLLWLTIYLDSQTTVVVFTWVGGFDCKIQTYVCCLIKTNSSIRILKDYLNLIKKETTKYVICIFFVIRIYIYIAKMKEKIYK